MSYLITCTHLHKCVHTARQAPCWFWVAGGGGGGGQCYPIYTRPLHDPTTHEAIMLILMGEAVGDSRQQEGGASLHTLQGHIPPSGFREDVSPFDHCTHLYKYTPTLTARCLPRVASYIDIMHVGAHHVQQKLLSLPYQSTFTYVLCTLWIGRGQCRPGN